MYLGNPVWDSHFCNPTLEVLAPGATVERVSTLDGFLYDSDLYDSVPVRMPPGRYTVTFFFTWILDDYGAQVRYIVQDVAIEWPAL